MASDNGKEYKPAPEGLHQGVCVDVIDIGMVETQYGLLHKVDIRWEIEELNPEDENKPFRVQCRYTLSLNDKANLTKHLNAWRGKVFTPEEKKGFDLEKLIGANCQLQLVHSISKNGRTYANIQAIVPISKTMTKLRPSDSYVRAKDRNPQGEPQNEPEVPDDDLPF
jgi:hypothetical protein